TGSSPGTFHTPFPGNKRLPNGGIPINGNEKIVIAIIASGTKMDNFTTVFFACFLILKPL
ncbi:unnamed protein product, partial [marine sediment metagenome]